MLGEIKGGRKLLCFFVIETLDDEYRLQNECVCVCRYVCMCVERWRGRLDGRMVDEWIKGEIKYR